MKTGNQTKSVVYIIDDDPSALRGLGRLMAAHGYGVHVFSSAREFLTSGPPGADACLLIDVAMPEMDGLQLYAELVRRGCQAPAIFITAQDDPATRESVKQAGAAGVFRKPVDGDELLEAIRRAHTADGGPGL
jgi:FixJ family two-component response regulator